MESEANEEEFRVSDEENQHIMAIDQTEPDSIVETTEDSTINELSDPPCCLDCRLKESEANEREFRRVSVDNCNVTGANDPTGPNSVVETAEIPTDERLDSAKYLMWMPFRLLVFLWDIGSDIFLAYNYFILKQYVYFYSTLAFVGVPAVMLTIVTSNMLPHLNKENVPLWKRNLRLVLLALQISPIIWYLECIQYAMALRGNPDLGSLKLKFVYADRGLALIGVLETTFEALPQLVLQITIFLIEGAPSMQSNLPITVCRYMSLFSSFTATVWAIVSYDRSRRLALLSPANMPWVKTIVMVLYIIPFLFSRILAVSEAAAVYPRATLFVCLIHWCVCFLAFSSYCPELNDSTFQTAIMGFVWIFYPLRLFLPSKLLTDKWYNLYYALCFLENSISVVVWIVNYDDLKRPSECEPIFRWLLPTVVMGGFFFSLIARREDEQLTALGTVCVCLIHGCFFALLLLMKHRSMAINNEDTRTAVDFWKSVIMGFAWIFYPLPRFKLSRDPSSHNNKLSYFYYSLTFLENSVSMVLWIVSEDRPLLRFLLPTLVMGGFFLSLIVRWIYIVRIVPSKDEADDWALI